jgi:hypothetical protein
MRSSSSRCRRTLRFRYPSQRSSPDVDRFHFEDLGHRLRNGRLMAQSNSEEGGDVRVGTLMIGETAPTGGYFFTGFEVPSVAAGRCEVG